ncbi:GerAB/ArcD/ProY family transporter [Niallia sp. 01092]|uniref:GerAB/ArcD/ProY family transporter n=1 Tax=unclassified Niallia TaxID=2837522 RepID=UPI003FCFB236
MEKAKINAIQLFSLMFIFNLGTALVINYGLLARKDAWFVVLLGTCAGIILFFLYYLLFRQYPKLPLTSYARKILGKYLGWIVGFLYVLYFLYIASRNIRDISDLLGASTLRETPSVAIAIPLIIAICYVLFLGVEVLARTSEVLIVMLFLFGAAGNFFVLVSGNIEFHNLLPFLENGWKPVLKTLPKIVPLPFGEMVVFTMLLPFLNQAKKVKKVWLWAMISSGVILSWTVGLNIAVLGVSATADATFPTLTTVGKINLLDFIQRLDAIVVFTMLITVFFKVSIFIYASVMGIADLFKLNNYQRILFPIGSIVVYISLIMAASFQEHIAEGDKMLYYMHFPMIIIIPLLLLLVSFIRSRFKQS